MVAPRVDIASALSNVIDNPSGIGNPFGEPIGLSADTRQQNMIFSGGLDQASAAVSRDAMLANWEPQESRSSIGLFLESAFSAGTKELLGSSPARHIERYRAESPMGGLISHLAGVAPFFIAPQLGVVRGLSMGIPGFKAALGIAQKYQKTEQLFKAGVVREVTKFAPLEAARLAGSAVNPEEGAFKRTAQHVAIELPLLGILGGTVDALGPRLKHFTSQRLENVNADLIQAREFKIQKHVGPAFDRSASTQTKWEYLDLWEKNLAKGGEQLAGSNPVAKDVAIIKGLYEKEILTGGPAIKTTGKTATKYVANTGDATQTKAIESLFEAGTQGGRGAAGITAKTFNTLSKDNPQGWATPELARLSRDGFERLTKGLRIGKEWMGFTQYPRQLVLTSESAKGRLQEILRKHFKEVGPGEWRAREVSEGLWIGVKRVAPEAGGSTIERAAARVDPTSGQFYIFKTSRPSKWFKNAAAVSDTNSQVFTANANKWGRAARVPDKDVPHLAAVERDAPFYKAGLQQLFSGKTRWSTDPNISAEMGALRHQINKFMPESVQPFLNTGVEGLGEIGRSLRLSTGPARSQGSNNPRLASLILWAKSTFDQAGAMSNEVLLGKISKEFMQGAKAPIRSIFRTAINPQILRREGGSQALIRKRLNSDSAALEDFNRIWSESLSKEAALAEGLHPEARLLAEELEAIDNVYVKRIADQARALGMDVNFTPKARHLGISRTWHGHFRAPIRDKTTNEILGYGSGFTKEAAANEANLIADFINAEEGRIVLKKFGESLSKDVDLTIKHDVWTAGTKDIEKKLSQLIEKNKKAAEARQGFDASIGLPSDMSSAQADVFGFATEINLGNPMVERIMRSRSTMIRNDPARFAHQRPGFLGGGGKSGRTLSTEEIVNRHSANIIETDRYLFREAFAAGPPGQELATLTAESSADAVTFNRIFNSYNGISGPVAKTIENGFDAVLGGFFGPGSAQKIMRGMNQSMFTLTLGAGDIGFAVLNLITPLQTAIPEVALLMRAAPETIQKYYSNALFTTANGGLRQARFMDTWKFAKVAMGDVWRPDAAGKEALQWAFERGAVGRDFVETVQGPMRALASGKGGMWDNLARMSEFPVVASEEASRAYSFMLGRRVAKDFFGMEEEAARTFGAQFVNNTMFGYSTADRPRMLTGALGAGWGLFKNWTTNYTANLGRYTAEASRGNFGPLMWAGATTGAVGGLAAIPAAGMADGLSRILADKPLSDLLYDFVGNDPGDSTKPWMADMMMHGFFSNLGFTLRARSSVPTSHLATDMTMFANISVLERAGSGLSAIGTMLDDLSDLRNPVRNPQFNRELLRAFAPRTLQRAMTSFGERGVSSLRTGNSLLPALNMYEGVLRIAGLTPVRVANAFEVHQNKIYDADAKRLAIQDLGRRWADAELNGDWEELRRVYQDAIIDENIPIGSVKRSADARMRNMSSNLLDRQLTDTQDRARLKMRGLY